jgi:hypothetical protein
MDEAPGSKGGYAAGRDTESLEEKKPNLVP